MRVDQEQRRTDPLSKLHMLSLRCLVEQYQRHRLCIAMHLHWVTQSQGHKQSKRHDQALTKLCRVRRECSWKRQGELGMSLLDSRHKQ